MTTLKAPIQLIEPSSKTRCCHLHWIEAPSNSVTRTHPRAPVKTLFVHSRAALTAVPAIHLELVRKKQITTSSRERIISVSTMELPAVHPQRLSYYIRVEVTGFHHGFVLAEKSQRSPTGLQGKGDKQRTTISTILGSFLLQFTSQQAD